MTGGAGIAEELSELGRAVAEARARLAGGLMIDMSAFEARLEDLCRRLEADRAAARQHLAVLGALRADLEALAEDVRTKLTALRATGRDPAAAQDPEAPADGTR